MPVQSLDAGGRRTDSASAAARLFEEHGDFIRAVIRFKAGNRVSVDDLVQDFFLSLVHKPLPPDVRDTRCYLYKMITSGVSDAIRRVGQYQQNLERYARKGNHPINDPPPDNVFIETEETSRVFELIERRLYPREAEAVLLRYKDDRSIEEIARTMRVDRRSVSRYIAVGLRKVRELLTAKRGDLR